MPWSTEQWHLLERIAKYSAQAGVVFTTGLSIYSLRSKTVIESENPLLPNKFTPAGRKYLKALIVLTTLTVASAVLQDIAERRIADEDKAQSEKDLDTRLGKRFGESLKAFDQELATEQKELIDSFGQALGKEQSSLAKGITDASSEVHDLQRQVHISERDSRYADRKVSALLLEVHLTGARRGEGHTPAEYALIQDRLADQSTKACADERNGQPSGPPENSCILHVNTQASFSVFDHLDPRSHFHVSITIELRSFTASIETIDCHGPDHYGCVRTSFRSTDGTDLTSRSGLQDQADPDDVGFLFSLVPDDNLFEKRTYLGRDTHLDYLHVQICDIHHVHETDRMRQQHLSQIKPDKEWEIDVVPSEGPQSPFDLEKKYSLRLSQSFGTGSAVCRSFRYLPY